MIGKICLSDLRDRVDLYVSKVEDDELGGLKIQDDFLASVFAHVKAVSTRDVTSKALKDLEEHKLLLRRALYQVSFRMTKELKSLSRIDWEGQILRVISEPIFEPTSDICRVFVVSKEV